MCAVEEGASDLVVPRFDGYEAASEESSRTKSRIRSSGTKPEMRLRRALWNLGLRYRVNVCSLPGSPDIVFTRSRVAVFCDGDFFHGRNWDVLRANLARRANPSYWISKIQYNRGRDKDVNLSLKEEGWLVLRFWESDIDTDIGRVVEAVRETIYRRRDSK